MADEVTTEKKRYNVVHIEQYVEEVLQYSSQYGSDNSTLYAAMNLTGKPSLFPEYGDSPQAFVMRTYGKWWDRAPSAVPPIMSQTIKKINSKDFVDIRFEQAVYPTMINIYETFNPGSVVRIWAFDICSAWHLLYEGSPKPTNENVSRIFSPPLKCVNFRSRLLRIEFEHSMFDYHTEIDAIMLVGSMPHPDSDELGELMSLVLRLNIHQIPAQQDTSEYMTNLIALVDTAQPDVVQPVPPSFGLENLPIEIVNHVLAYLDLTSLRRMAQTSHRFYDLVNQPFLYSELNMNSYWWCAKAALTGLSPYLCRLRRLELSWVFATRLPQFLSLLGSGCPLTHLRLGHSRFVNNDTLTMITVSCPDLVELSIRGCQNVDSFVDMARMTQLERLDLYRTNVDSASLIAVLRANPGLLHLNLGSCKRLDRMDDIMCIVSEFNTRLISLDVWKTDSLTCLGLKHLSKCRALEEMDLGWSLSLNEVGEGLHMIATNCVKLRKLFLGACRGLKCHDLKSFIGLPLEQVDLVGIRSITPAAVCKLLNGCPTLRLLDVSFCDLVLDSDVSSLRSIFPKVQIKKSNSADQT